MKSLKLDDLKSIEIDYSKIVNHTQDVSVDSILCIDHYDREKLDHYIELSLKQNPKYIITSSRSEVLNDRVLRFEEYQTIFDHVLQEIAPNYKKLDYFNFK